MSGQSQLPPFLHELTQFRDRDGLKVNLSVQVPADMSLNDFIESRRLEDATFWVEAIAWLEKQIEEWQSEADEE